jgi:hypothetical protein
LNFEEDAVDTLTRTRPPCKACHARYRTMAGGLCWVCARRAMVRRFTASGVGLTAPTKRPTPTKAIQGSREKLEVLCRRAERGEELWHEEDGEQ